MALKEITVPDCLPAVPKEVAGFLDEADRRIDAFFASGENRTIPKYLPSNAAITYQVLAWLTAADLPLGRVFCELGSGFGVAAGLAAMLGYESYGIEWEDKLVRMSRALLRDTGVDPSILHTSYLPEGYEVFTSAGEPGLIIPDHHSDHGLGEYFPPTFEGMPHTTDEVAVYFVYPWPSERHLMQRLFENLACEGAILLLHSGDEELRVFLRLEADERTQSEAEDENSAIDVDDVR
jgi:hypothetical protein